MSAETIAQQKPPIDAPPAKPKTPVSVIQPTRGWSGVDLREVWQYRELLWLLIARDIKGRYRQMALGPLWIVIKPLVNMVVFSVILGRMAKLPSDGLPYPIFVFTAQLPWLFFTNATSASANSLVSRMHVISKVYFPRIVVPIAAVLSGLVDLLVCSVVLVALMIYYKAVPTVAMLTLPFYVLMAVATALGVGLWCATLAVRFRDLEFAITYGLQVLMFATPVVYAASVAEKHMSHFWQVIYRLNPMYWVVEGFRWALLGKGQPPETMTFVSVGCVLLVLISGTFIFRRTERTIVDLL
jgi:lipopolysaccharide transport system permease protein